MSVLVIAVVTVVIIIVVLCLLMRGDPHVTYLSGHVLKSPTTPPLVTVTESTRLHRRTFRTVQMMRQLARLNSSEMYMQTH